jgi:hypothetical protein
MNQTKIFFLFLTIGTASQTDGQGTFSFVQSRFQNLDFELAQLPVLAPDQFGGPVAGGEAIPGWTAYTFGSPVAQVLHNGTTLGSPAVTIYGPNWTGSEILGGHYSVQIKSGTRSSGLSSAIGQAGEIPISAKSLLFSATGYQELSFTGLELSFAGNQMPFVLLSSNSGYDVLGADISAYAGKTGELRFTVKPRSPITGFGNAVLDNVAFSTQIVPEPSSPALWLGGLAILSLFAARKQR